MQELTIIELGEADELMGYNCQKMVPCTPQNLAPVHMPLFSSPWIVSFPFLALHLKASMDGLGKAWKINAGNQNALIMVGGQ